MIKIKNCLQKFVLGGTIVSLVICGAVYSDISYTAQAEEMSGEHEIKTDAMFASLGAGIYGFIEKVNFAEDMFGQDVWYLTLKEDSTYELLAKGEGMRSDASITGAYTKDGNTVSLGRPNEAEISSDITNHIWFNEDYSLSVTIDDQTHTFKPASYDEETNHINMDGAGIGGESKGFEIVDAAISLNVNYAPDYKASSAQLMDVYVPTKVAGKKPLIVVTHGGGFRFGSQDMEIIKPIVEYGVKNGYVVASVDYRKSEEAVFPGAVADEKAAVRYLKANAAAYDIDTSKIVVWGESAGAYLAAMTATTSEVSALDADITDNSGETSTVNALVDFYGPIEFYTMDAEFTALGKAGQANHTDSSSFESAFLGAALDADQTKTYTTYWETYAEQLKTQIAKTKLSAWIQAGTNDDNVPYTQSQNFAERLGAVIGSENVKFGLIESAAHEDAKFYTEENMADIFAWLETVLSNSDSETVSSETTTSSSSTVVKKPSGTTITGIKAGKKKITVQWKAKTGVSGYQIAYATSKKFTSAKKVTVKSKKTKKKVIKKLKSKKTYYVRIRTYKTENGTSVYSSWSSIKNVKVK